MRGLFIPEITAEMFRNGCLESIEALMTEGKIYDIDYQQPREDCVSRAELLRLLDLETQDTNPSHFNLEDKEDYRKWMLNNGYNTALVQARIYVENLPSAQPQIEPCEDAISRKAVEDITWEEPSYTDALNVLTEVREKIKQLSPVTSWSDWIPVSEKLPEPLTAVLLSVRYKSTGHWTYQIGYWEDALEKWEKWLEIGTLDDEFEILAWMELPEGYEEGNHE